MGAGTVGALAPQLEGVGARSVGAFVELAKPRVVAMVLVTTAAGFFLGTAGTVDYVRLTLTLVGTALAAGGTLALNQYLERDYDALMERTRHRPLPTGRVRAADGLYFGAALTGAGVAGLTLTVDPVAGMLTALVTLSYLFAYTPLKRRHPLCTVVGSVPGALPPVTGWVAASGQLDAGALVLFAILFLWQMPHSLAIAKVYADDYARGGFRLLPVVDPDGRSTERQVVSYSTALLAVGLAPTVLGIVGALYFAVALVAGAGLLAVGIDDAVRRTPTTARRLLVASLLHLPVILAGMVADRVLLG